MWKIISHFPYGYVKQLALGISFHFNHAASQKLAFSNRNMFKMTKIWCLHHFIIQRNEFIKMIPYVAQGISWALCWSLSNKKALLWCDSGMKQAILFKSLTSCGHSEWTDLWGGSIHRSEFHSVVMKIRVSRGAADHGSGMVRER